MCEVDRKRDLLQEDKAKLHSDKQTKEKFKDLETSELLPHPASGKILAMDKRTLYKILVLIITLSLISILTVYFLRNKNSDSQGKTFPPGQEWSCEIVNGTSCKGASEVRNVGAKDYIYNGSTSWTCTDIKKREFETFKFTRLTITNEIFFGIAKCMDIDTRTSSIGLTCTPCILDFKVCIKDPRVPAVTLSCKYLKDFKQIDNQVSSLDSQNVTCGTNNTVHTYYMDTGYSVTKIEYNNNKIYFEKPILPDALPTNATLL